MKEQKLYQAALKAKKDGYEYFTSIVKSHKATTYHHYVSIDRIIDNGGKWIPANFNSYRWRGRVGVTTKQLPENCINKSIAIRKYCK